MKPRIGFMQGRLSPAVDGRIQAFPWKDWENEFPSAQATGLHLMEWTLDYDRIHQNPLLTPTGQVRIRHLGAKYDVTVPSVTGDCFMQAPFWKATGSDRIALQEDFIQVVTACQNLGVAIVVVPLVDNGTLENRAQEDVLVDFLLHQQELPKHGGVSIVFECDYAPDKLGRFIERLPAHRFGVNYDIGNSAALGYRPAEEFQCYGVRVQNVHVKDRTLGGTTVPLGTGDADFAAVFEQLAACRYSGNYIMQTARSNDGDHRGVLRAYRDMILTWINA